MGTPSDILREFLREALNEYWGEPSGSVVRDKATIQAQRESPIEDPFMHKKKGVYVPKDARREIDDYFKDMKLEPTDEPGKTYK